LTAALNRLDVPAVRSFAKLVLERIARASTPACSPPPFLAPRPRVAPVAEERRVVAGDAVGGEYTGSDNRGDNLT
jgi:hypothetical protein